MNKRKVFTIILLSYLLTCQLSCKLPRWCESNENDKFKKISEQLQQEGHQVSTVALINHTLVYGPNTKILYIYVKDDMDLVNKLISDRAEIEKVAASILDKETKFKIFYYSDKRVEEF